MRTVLIVEDDPTMLRGLKDNFEMKGYYVQTATDGKQGLEAALKEKPDLIVLDTNLLTCPEEEIIETEVLYTFIAGKQVHPRD